MQTTRIGRPRGLPDLNFDILLQITSPLTRRDVACLSRTCHALRRALSAELPRGGVTLKGRHLTSFLMFADRKHGKDRLHYFHELDLHGSTYSSIASDGQAKSISDVKRALSAILLAARNLKSLSILDLNVFVFRPDELKTLLDSLPRLCDLEMSGIEKKYEGVLVGVLPRLRTLGLEFLEKSNASAFLKVETPQRDLQEVTLYNASFKNPYAPLSFPSVHTLRVCPARFPSDVDTLTRLFPNVVDLTFDFHPEYGHLDTKYLKDVRRYRPTMPWTDPLVKKWRDLLLSRPEKERMRGCTSRPSARQGWG
ncbi:hypothetical protein LXA43DRAFT_579094 [Ganoderma leucocontextum]|nr:hypothetical protein LXA43DRAFT_579094 [Ganoderma leucocontextum]